MATIFHAEQSDPSQLRLCHGRLIVISRSISKTVQILLKAWLNRHSNQRVQCYVLDVSPGGEIEKAVGEMLLPDLARHDIKVWSAPDSDDEAACKALQRFMLDSGAGTQSTEVILELHPRAFPELTAACQQLASAWFHGRGSKQAQESWAFDALGEPGGLRKIDTGGAEHAFRQSARPAGEATGDSPQRDGIALEYFRYCSVKRRFPRRPSLLLIAPSSWNATFLSSLAQLPSSWLSFVQVIDSGEGVDECWKWPKPPDIIFSDLVSFKDLIIRGQWSSAAWVVADEDNGFAARFFLSACDADAKTRNKLPEVVVDWSPELPECIYPLRVTRPLERSPHHLPSISYYQQIPELQQLRELWQAGIPKVVTLVGYGGTGKTALAQRWVEECVLTRAEAESESERNLPTADAAFVWDFYAEPFSEKFLKSFARYLDPDGGADASSEECLRLIREKIDRRNLRRTLLIMDGLETIQRPRSGTADEGDLQDHLVLELLTEIADGGLPIIALLTTRLAPAGLRGRADGYVEIQVSKLPLAAARNLLRVSGGFDDDENLTSLAERFGYHAMTLYHLGRLLGDFYQGDTKAAARLPVLEDIFQHSRVEEIDELNRCFVQLFARYEEHLPEQELAVLTRLAVVGEPLSVSEFAQIFAESEKEHVAGPLAGLPLDELQARFDTLHARQLLNVHVESARAKRYAAHPALAYYFANALAADAESLRLGARDYYQQRLSLLGSADQSATHVKVRTHGAVRSRSAAIGPRGSQINYPTNPIILDLLERIISHTIHSGRPEEARFYYQRRMGGGEHLKAIGEHARAQRINARLGETHP